MKPSFRPSAGESGPHDWLDGVRERLSRRGFNLTGLVDAKRFDAWAPAGQRLEEVLSGARSAIMIAAGGRALWRAIAEESRSSNRGRSGAGEPGADPIDRFSEKTILEEAALIRGALPRARIAAAFPFGGGAEHLPYIRLAEHAGLGTSETVLGLLLHPEFGPWVSLRGCLITDLPLPASQPLDEFRPCEGCARPCLTTCPVTALTEAGWDHAACFSHRTSGPNCLDGCAPRIACPVGQQHRFGEEEMRHRQIAALP